MLYLKTSENEPRIFEPLLSWGPFVCFLEIGDDLFPTRTIDLFENGYALRYDRAHWVDRLGSLGNMRYDRKKWEKWWGPSFEIEAAEFEEQWHLSESSPALSLQRSTALMADAGPVPIWLRPRADRA